LTCECSCWGAPLASPAVARIAGHMKPANRTLTTGLPRVMERPFRFRRVAACVCSPCLQPARFPHLYTIVGRCRRAGASAHSGGGPEKQSPDPPHWARQLCEPWRAGVLSTGLLLFHRAIRRLARARLSRNREHALCPIHTTPCVNPNRAAQAGEPDQPTGRRAALETRGASSLFPRVAVPSFAAKSALAVIFRHNYR
jgi:hypothetical protein